LSCAGNYRFNNNKYGHNPAPVKLIRFSHPTITTQFVDDEALIDSGSSITLIPKNIAETLGLQEIDRRQIRDFEGKISSELKPVYVVQVSCDTITHTIQVIETDGIPIIGRDIMNQLETRLIGTRQTWSMQ